MFHHFKASTSLHSFLHSSSSTFISLFKITLNWVFSKDIIMAFFRPTSRSPLLLLFPIKNLGRFIFTILLQHAQNQGSFQLSMISAEDFIDPFIKNLTITAFHDLWPYIILELTLANSGPTDYSTNNPTNYCKPEHMPCPLPYPCSSHGAPSNHLIRKMQATDSTSQTRAQVQSLFWNAEMPSRTIHQIIVARANVGVWFEWTWGRNVTRTHDVQAY